jgi:hypothetical protein
MSLTVRLAGKQWVILGSMKWPHDLFIKDKNGGFVAKVYGGQDRKKPGRRPQNINANAAAIAAVPQLLEQTETLMNFFKEAHQHEIDKNHYGDTTPCSYCQAIKDAETLLKKIDDAEPEIINSDCLTGLGTCRDALTSDKVIDGLADDIFECGGK